MSLGLDFYGMIVELNGTNMIMASLVTLTCILIV